MEIPSTFGRLAITTGATTLVGGACLVVFAIAGQPFGHINDVCNGLSGLLFAVLATKLATVASRARIVAWAGALFVVVGSVLVLARISGWLLASHYTSLGFALIGLWIFASSRALAKTGGISRGLAIHGQVAGALAWLGFASIFGVVRGLDDPKTAPGIVWLGEMGFLGWGLVAPVWAIRLGRALRRTEG